MSIKPLLSWKILTFDLLFTSPAVFYTYIANNSVKLCEKTHPLAGKLYFIVRDHLINGGFWNDIGPDLHLAGFVS